MNKGDGINDSVFFVLLYLIIPLHTLQDSEPYLLLNVSSIYFFLTERTEDMEPKVFEPLAIKFYYLSPTDNTDFFALLKILATLGNLSKLNCPRLSQDFSDFCHPDLIIRSLTTSKSLYG